MDVVFANLMLLAQLKGLAIDVEELMIHKFGYCQIKKCMMIGAPSCMTEGS